MIENGHVLIHEDVVNEEFVCDLTRCKGACCVQGSAGAPLEQDELEVLVDIYNKVKDYLPPEGRATIEREGAFVTDFEGDYTTPCVNGDEECAYTVFSADGTASCGIEKAWADGKIAFRKPISCHLYPIRVTRYPEFELLNYDKWSAVCSPACELGKKLKVPLYEFLKDPLIRKYGQKWYNELKANLAVREAGLPDGKAGSTKQKA